ncbi:DUF7344 domain-containing protein [Haloarcula laminariae]|uniref:DUF7344 domain-containing protein n=1 Tax=Haloarcula laminariae TaxID=2961577 RepID=UPI0024055FAA|nr:hypothetical protein [Halomicroarcula sp. FL173]
MTDQAIGYGPLFSVLAHPRRRALVVLLAIAPEGSLDLATAAHVLAVLEDGSGVSTKQVRNVRTSLKRSHQAPLQTADIVEYGTSRLERGPRFGAAVRAIAHAAEKPQTQQ